MSFLPRLCIYKDEIEEAEELCSKLLAEAKDIAMNFGTLDDATSLNGYLNDEAFAIFKNSEIDLENMTNCIIKAYFTATKNRLAKCKLFSEYNIQFDSYINGLDSHLNILQGDNAVDYFEGELWDIVKSSFVKPVYESIRKYLDENMPSKNYPIDWVETDIREGRFENEDIAHCLDTGKITGTIKQEVFEFAKEDA